MIHSILMIYTLVPLGNPGEKYARTRHNAARLMLSYCAEELENVPAVEVFIPDTFMNESGKAVAEYLRYHNDREIVVIYDDKDLPLGKIRISHDRGDGGHNGVKSVIVSLGTKEFIRIRIGVAHKDTDGKDVKAPHGEEVQKHVMGNFTEEELVLLKEVALGKGIQAITSIAKEGYQKAMDMCN